MLSCDASVDEGEKTGFVSALVEQWPAFRYLGLGIWWGWIWLCYSSTQLMGFYPVEAQTTLVFRMYIESTFAIGIMVLAAAVFSTRFHPLIANGKWVVVFGAIASVATLLVAFSWWTGSVILFNACAIATGIGTSFLCLRVGHIYGRIGLHDSMLNASVAVVLAMFLYFVGIGLPQPLDMVFIAILPVLAALVLCLPGHEQEQLFEEKFAHRHLGDNFPARKLYTRLLIALGIIALAAGISKGLVSYVGGGSDFFGSGLTVTFGVGLAALLIAAITCTGRSIERVARAYSVFMVFIVVVFLASDFGFDLVYLNIGKDALYLIFTCLLAYVVMRFELSPCRLFGFGQGVYFLCSAFGWLIGAGMSGVQSDDKTYLFFSFAFALVFIFVLVFVFTENHVKQIGDDSLLTLEGPAARGDDESGEGTSQFFIDPAFGLTQREAEVLLLFAQGRSASWIADDLYLSPNTVRTHLRSVYTKLGIHSRQELLDLVER